MTRSRSVRRLARITSVLVLVLAPSCISVTYQRDRRYERLPPSALAELAPGTAQLGECLARLGAPLWAWEDSVDGRPGAALAWGWLDAADWSVTASVPVSDQSSVSFTWRDLDARMRGVVLFFDADWRLVGVREGLLREIYASASSRRPAWTEELEEEP